MILIMIMTIERYAADASQSSSSKKIKIQRISNIQYKIRANYDGGLIFSLRTHNSFSFSLRC